MSSLPRRLDKLEQRRALEARAQERVRPDVSLTPRERVRLLLTFFEYSDVSHGGTGTNAVTIFLRDALDTQTCAEAVAHLNELRGATDLARPPGHAGTV